MDLTDRDQLIFEWLTLVPASTYEDLADATGRSVDALRHRLPRLRRAGYLQRRLVQDEHRFAALWSPTAAATTGLRRRELRLPPAELEQDDAGRADVLAQALLPHFQRRDNATTIYRGSALADRIDRLTYTAGMKGVSLDTTQAHALHPHPQFFVERGGDLTALEVPTAHTSVDWTQRLQTYTLLGVNRVEIYTDAPLFEPSLRHAIAGLLTPAVRIVRPTGDGSATRR